MNEIMFHTQENRESILTEPCLCKRRDAWLGTAYYFWGYEEDAIRGGRILRMVDSKFILQELSRIKF